MKSPESIKKEAAIEMFSCSVEKRGLKHTTYIGDRDSSSYGIVAQALKEKYTDQYVVVKDCIGHIQKRTNLCKYKTEKKNLTACAAQCVTKWKQGAAVWETVLHDCGVSKYGINNLCDICKENSTQIVWSSVKWKNRYIKRRETLRQERKSKLADRLNHLSGAFSLEPETKKKKKTKKCKKHL